MSSVYQSTNDVVSAIKAVAYPIPHGLLKPLDRLADSSWRAFNSARAQGKPQHGTRLAREKPFQNRACPKQLYRSLANKAPLAHCEDAQLFGKLAKKKNKKRKNASRKREAYSASEQIVRHSGAALS